MKKLPTFRTDEEAEKFVATADLTEYDLSGARLMRFEFEKKEARLNMRLPESLLAAVRATAAKRGVPYQRLIREILEGAVATRSQTSSAAARRGSRT
jgi:predicted DNA binding CopG/RHH family protein